MKSNIQIVLVFGLIINLVWTLAIADEETTFATSLEQSGTDATTVTLLTTLNATTEATTLNATTEATTLNATTEASTFKPSAVKFPGKLLSSNISEGKPKEKTFRESDDCDEQLLIYEDRIADLDTKLATYSQQKKALTSVMKIVLELLMNEVSLGTDDDLDRKS
ncbi:unnamed protein product [Diamesa hyperborea]